MMPLRALVGLSCITTTLAIASADIVPQTIVLKLRRGSIEHTQWLSAGRSGRLTFLNSMLGEHRTRPYLRDAVLSALSKRINDHAARSSNDVISSLESIAIVEFEQKLDARTIASKLSRHPSIEYAEPLPVRRIFFQPNDSLFTFQYYLTKIQAPEAWDSIAASVDKILIAIIDTGIDYTHEDLIGVVYTNPGEAGYDSNGRDKRINGVDDDHNGFVDDWRGWDFGLNDNDPRPGNAHGTHVAGIAAAQVNNRIGVAGVCTHARVLPIKCASDSPFTPSILNGYEGIAYAAAVGAKVINCSWGGGTKSQAEQEVITTAIGLGSVVVAAGGNSGVEEELFPAGYEGVLSVAAVGSNDVRASFSSFYSTIDISAPGASILSTVPGNRYELFDGTSMASPVVAGVAALVRAKYPSLSPAQVVARLKATADPIDNIPGNRNRPWMGKLGAGRINAYAAVTQAHPKYVELISTSITDDDGDGVFEPGNIVRILPTFRNLLAPVSQARALIQPARSGTPFRFTDSLIELGSLGSNAVLTAPGTFSITIPQNSPQNYILSCQILVIEGTTIIGRGIITLIIMPTYRTLRNRDLVLTVNSIGNFAYNDYPTNTQGEGFRYKGSPSVLFEGGLMIGYSSDNLSNVARNNSGRAQDKDFQILIPATLQALSHHAGQHIETTFADDGAASQANVHVKQQVYVFDEYAKRNFALAIYDITNRNEIPIETMHCGIYADWDIGSNGQNDIAIWSDADGFYYAYNTRDTSLPYVGMQLVSNHTINAFMIDNDGNTYDNPGVYDGYTLEEKWRTLSSGIARKQSRITDASAVIAAGPFAMEPGQSERVVFSIFAGKDLLELRNASSTARTVAQQLLNISPFDPSYTTQPFIHVHPNPVINDCITIDYPITSDTQLRIVDLTGRIIDAEFVPIKQNNSHRERVMAKVSVGSGVYFVVAQGSQSTIVVPFVVLH